MRLTLSLPNETIATVDVTEQTQYSALKLQISVEAELNTDQFIIVKDGNLLVGPDEATIKELGVKDNDLLFVATDTEKRLQSMSRQIKSSSGMNPSLLEALDFSNIQLPSSQDSGLSSSEPARQMLLHASPYQLSVIKERNPDLAAAMNDPVEFARVYEAQRRRAQENEAELEKLMNGDQLDPNIQARIAELIQQRNIDTQMETALEHYPETFGQVTMLYVHCRVQGHEIKAFVDSGAQTTIMSENCARRCGLDRLIDKRWAGKAYGVGTQVIIGRVHNSLIEIGGIFIPTSFIVLQDQPLDLLIGLDMLKRHQCTIDLRSNVLIIDGRVKAPFLPESELPLSARHPEMQDFEMHPHDTCDSGRGPVPNTSNLPESVAAQSSQDKLTPEQESKVVQLSNEGIPRQQAIEELRSVNWDIDAAYAAYLFKQDGN